jgi:hypothetical protein
MLDRFRTALFLVAAMFIAAPTSWSTTSPVILSTVVNTSNNQITLNGGDFSPTGTAPNREPR